MSVETHLTGSYHEQLIDARYRYLQVWKQHDGLWKVIAGNGVEVR